MTEAKEKDAEIEKKYDAIFSEFLTSKQVYKMKGCRGKIPEQDARDASQEKVREFPEEIIRDCRGAPGENPREFCFK